MYITVTQSAYAAGLWHDASVVPRRSPRVALRQNTPLANVLHLGIGLNHSRALRAGVRVRGYARAQSLPLADVRVVLARLDRLVGQAICSAHRDSLVIAELGMTKGKVHLRLRYARSAPGKTNDLTGLNWIDEFWSFDPKTKACSH
jgi:hypothetical protein